MLSPLLESALSKKNLFMSKCLLSCSANIVIVILLPFLLIISQELFAADKIVIDDFEDGLSSHWSVKEFKGMTVYSIHEENGNKSLKAYSRDTASALIYKISYDLKEFPFLTWKWKVMNIISTGDATKKAGDDYAARIYVIFPHWIPVFTKSINYIWANKLKKGDTIPNSFYSRVVMVAVESGTEMTGEWISEKRNVLEDYKAIFGEDPATPEAIAIMTDTDNTGEEAVAYYDDIVLRR